MLLDMIVFYTLKIIAGFRTKHWYDWAMAHTNQNYIQQNKG